MAERRPLRRHVSNYFGILVKRLGELLQHRAAQVRMVKARRPWRSHVVLDEFERLSALGCRGIARTQGRRPLHPPPRQPGCSNRNALVGPRPRRRRVIYPRGTTYP